MSGKNSKQFHRIYFCLVFVKETSSAVISFTRSFFSLLPLIKVVNTSSCDCLTSPRFVRINSLIKGIIVVLAIQLNAAEMVSLADSGLAKIYLDLLIFFLEIKKNVVADRNAT